ncbi:MAG: D-Ala-D-Ala carboxypeptidase family metallohydrolase [Pseudomonadota bacterium]|nr:D-Ala-D-Ala carboxypeptidase family metallohydrolase [Pseudomonadota bacterium]
MESFYAHWSQVPAAEWRWPNFTPKEIACRGTGAITIVPEALDKLQALRDTIGKPLIINSAYRSPSHNAKVGGSPQSKHLLGIAFDISLKGHDRYRLTHAAEEVGFMGIGQYPSFVHLDTRETPARWDKR